jgi:hypothetical protein
MKLGYPVSGDAPLARSPLVIQAQKALG